MTASDLRDLIEERCANKIAAGKSPSKADLTWLDATEVKHTDSSVSLTRNAKGEMQFEVKCYHADPMIAAENAKQLANQLRATYPMADGTVGSPMRDVKKAS